MQSILALLLYLVALINGQVEVPGRFKRCTFDELLATYPLDEYIILPPIDTESLREQAEAEDSLFEPRWFAHAVHIPYLNMHLRGHRTNDNNGTIRRWHLAIASPGAISLSLLFNDFYLPRGSEFYVIGKNRTAGAFTGPINNKDDHHFAVAPINGDVLFLEYITADSEDVEASTDDYQLEPHIEVWKVVHGFRSIYQFFPSPYIQDGFQSRKIIEQLLTRIRQEKNQLPAAK